MKSYPRKKARDDFHGLGINITCKLLTQNTANLYIKELVRLKVTWVRIGFDFYSYKADKFQWKKISYLVEQLNKSGISIVGTLMGETPGTVRSVFSPESGYQSVMDSLPTYLDFVRECMTNFGNIITHWEVWNEPNLKRFWVHSPSPNEYVELLKATSATIRNLQAEAKIIFGGISGDDRVNILPMPKELAYNKDFYKKTVQLGAAKYFDIANFHPYFLACYASLRAKPYFIKIITQKIQSLKHRISKITPNKEIWITEFGISKTLNPQMNRLDINECYTHLLKECQKLGIPVAIWVLHDEDPTYSRINPERGFGLMENIR